MGGAWLTSVAGPIVPEAAEVAEVARVQWGLQLAEAEITAAYPLRDAYLMEKRSSRGSRVAAPASWGGDEEEEEQQQLARQQRREAGRRKRDEEKQQQQYLWFQ